MFTGIVEEQGRIGEIRSSSEGTTVLVKARKVLEDARQGDSIALNGVCVTVTSFTAEAFRADLSPETMKRTNLRSLNPGSLVNLERAMSAGGRFGGHIVSGHVDGIGEILERKEEKNSLIFTIRPLVEQMKYIAFKGSVTLDGISLTVASCTDREFSVAIIPFTLRHTTLYHKKAGDRVNLECDIISKYVERLLHFPVETKHTTGLTEKTLKETGFFL